MRSYDLSPLFRSTIGFDRWADLFEAANRVNPSASTFPPYNIEKRGDDAYRITMAVAGFGESCRGSILATRASPAIGSTGPRPGNRAGAGPTGRWSGPPATPCSPGRASSPSPRGSPTW